MLSSKNPITANLSRLGEHRRSNASLHQSTLFPLSSAHLVSTSLRGNASLRSATLSFRFGGVNYAKGRTLPFFRALELLTGRKGVAVLSRRAVPARKVIKGGLVGCRVTLRRSALVSFLETLGLALPRRERFAPPRWTARVRASPDNAGRSTRSLRSFRFSELITLPPFERGLGVHPDVQTIQLSVQPASRSREEAYFLLRTAKLPVL